MKVLKYKVVAFISLVILGAAAINSCKKVLDKDDLTAIPEDAVWNDTKLATAFLNKLYVDNMPRWPVDTLSQSDEDAEGAGSIMYGQLTANTINYWPYNKIRSINVLLRDVGKGSLAKAEQDVLKGQALFLRAWQYFQLVSSYGGVPLILAPQDLKDNLEVSRNKTSECIAQIINDLDNAAALLPDAWDGENAGRITKGAALAFKGRVLLHYASEQFDPGQTASGRWQNAYDANKAAKDALTAAGKSLMPDFKKLWITEGNANTEAVLVTRFINPGLTHTRDACVRPLDEAQNCTGADQPSLAMVQAFPMKNGLPITDPASGYNPDAYWLNRDPRFGATIAYNGNLWELSGKAGRVQWTFLGSQQSGQTATGFYCKKGINESYKPNETELSGTDWIEIRFAEVLLNLAEAANETGKMNEAYEVLKAIRQRAGIDAGGNGLYGLKAGMTPAEMRNAVLLERMIEFAFEGKRQQDLRRRRLYGALNGTKRKGYTINLIAFGGDKNQFFKAYAAGTVNLNTSYTTYFKDVITNLDLTNTINYKPEYYFYAIPNSHREKNKNLAQTTGWDGGTFDPLQ